MIGGFRTGIVLPVLLCILLRYRLLQKVEADEISPCLIQSSYNNSCSHCMELNSICAWCIDENFDDEAQISRCGTVEFLKNIKCRSEYIYKPDTTVVASKDDPLSNAGESEKDAVQLKPQEFKINIRPKDKVKFQIVYRQAIDYPVDLYYLMDLSNSMADDKDKLAELGESLSARMKMITKNFRLGFGSFIDKDIIPFNDPRPERAQHPVKNCSGPCSAPYGFRHQMSLSQDAKRFSVEVQEALISANLDAPEGGLDAIVQVLACKDKVGWRTSARKIIVLSSDASFHFAGDGRLAGIVRPNDGQCHLNDSGYYTMSKEQDYPSIGMLHQKLLEKKANLIFAINETHQRVYNSLKDALPGISSSVGILADDSTNIIDLIETEYQKISQEVVMVDNANVSQGLRLSYKTRCPNGPWKDSNGCDGIKVGDEVIFEATLEVSHCDSKHDFVIEIGPRGLDETVSVSVHVQCDCECEKQNVIRNADQCRGKGDLVCGVCSCHGTNSGSECQCDTASLSSNALLDMCRKVENGPVCEDRGICECGECQCKQTRPNPSEKFYGRYCECDNFNCPRHNRLLCAGNGECNCGKCLCKEGWTGIACQCPERTDSCLAANGKICNGHGQCVCGQCLCNTGEIHRYSGPKCEICPSCPSKCNEYKPCVMCQQWKTGPYNGTDCEDCPFDAKPVDDFSELNGTERCQFVDNADGCTFYFHFLDDEEENTTMVWVKKKKDCPGPVPVLAISGGVIAAIVLLGLLLLLIWKVLTMIHDRREYAAFEKERSGDKWTTQQLNPLYTPATSSFKNPGYGGSTAKDKHQ